MDVDDWRAVEDDKTDYDVDLDHCRRRLRNGGPFFEAAEGRLQNMRDILPLVLAAGVIPLSAVREKRAQRLFHVKDLFRIGVAKGFEGGQLYHNIRQTPQILKSKGPFQLLRNELKTALFHLIRCYRQR